MTNKKDEVQCPNHKLVVLLSISNLGTLLFLLAILSSSGPTVVVLPTPPDLPSSHQQEGRGENSSHLRANKNNDDGIVNSHHVSNKNITDPSTTPEFSYHHHPHVFGFVHIAKTAGSYINSYLAAHYERVCGDKGNSYDSAALYRRVNETIQSQLDHHQQPCRNVLCNYGDDIIRKTYPNGYGRARVPFEVMKEVGFEDCDYIALEIHAEDWVDVASRLRGAPSSFLGSTSPERGDVKLELHVPCRDPIDHLLSQCNHGKKEVSCTSSKELYSMVDECMFGHKRFDIDLWTNSPFFQVQCFDATSQLDMYLKYMSNILQPRRHIVEEYYVSLASNEPRHKEDECLLREENAALRQQVRKYMLQMYPYYSWCQECLDGPDDLLK